jgi:hypothetical protein
MEPCTAKQAEVIGKKLYTKEKNQEHCTKWIETHLSKQQASDIIQRVIKLKYDLAMSNAREFERIQEWGRAKVKEHGYQEPEINPSL